MDNHYKRRVPDGKAKVAGVIGWPVEHSLSPRLMNHWLAYHYVDGLYIPMPVKPEHLEDVIRTLPKMGFRGINVTIPHKVTIMPLLDAIDDTAKTIGAVNTVTIDAEGKLHGSNTDAYGFIKNVGPQLPIKLSKAVVLGAGGAAKAVCYALLKEGFKQTVVVNRTIEKAHELAAQFSNITVEAWDNRAHILADADLLVNATSLGMVGAEPLDIDLARLPKTAIVADIVYVPLITPLLAQAKERGNKIVDGIGMLLNQAAPGFKSWYGISPEVSNELLKEYMTSA